MEIFESKEFTHVDFTSTPLLQGEYEDCQFSNCNLEASDLNNFSFVGCQFINCNLSNIKVDHTSFKDIAFENCKMLGVDFSVANPFLMAFNFVNCQLDFSSFYRLKIKGTFFKDCSLQEVDFVETCLEKGKLTGCNLLQAQFDNSLLAYVDFSDAIHFNIDPNHNYISGATFSRDSLMGLLAQHNIQVSE